MVFCAMTGGAMYIDCSTSWTMSQLNETALHINRSLVYAPNVN